MRLDPPRRLSFPARLFWLALTAVPMAVSGLAAETDETTSAVISQRYSAEGADIELRIAPLDEAPSDGAEATARMLSVEFAVTDSASGSPIQGLSPAAWMDLKAEDGEGLTCKEKVESSLSGGLAYRPTADLNSWYVLTLNEKASITVLDPQIDVNVTKMLALIGLESPGADWAQADDLDSLFVTMPLSDQVAVIDTRGWKVAANIDAGPRPTRAVLQPDGRYLWVANDAAERGAGGVTIIDTRTREVAAEIKTGDGRHDIAISGDDRFAAVTNSADGHVSIIDVRDLRELKRIDTGERPISVTWSEQANAFYVADTRLGEVVALDPASLEVRARIGAAPGLGMLRASPDGRWVLAVNRDESLVHVVDTAGDRIAHEISVGLEPDHVTFTEQYAYVRSLGSDRITLIALAELGNAGTVPAIEVSGGQGLPGEGLPAIASPIVPTPEENAVLIANPRDQMVYYYMEGMGAPMGSFRNFRRQARAVAAVDRSLRETAPGVYATTVQVPTHGRYDVAFLLDSPLVIHCFDIAVPQSSALPQTAALRPPRLEFLTDDRLTAVGEELGLRFKLTVDGAGTGGQGPGSVHALAVLAPGIWHRRIEALPVGDGVYEVPVTLPREGVYYVYVGAPSLGIAYEELPHLILHARNPG
ncbi:MAG TPA: YncE family protein [Afifellaceae bacterium]|nr:YncE family protein [Afifellaceae bacterium]